MKCRVVANMSKIHLYICVGTFVMILVLLVFITRRFKTNDAIVRDARAEPPQRFQGSSKCFSCERQMQNPHGAKCFDCEEQRSLEFLQPSYSRPVMFGAH